MKGYSTYFGFGKQNCLHTLSLRDKLQEQEGQIQKLQKISKVVKEQRQALDLVLQNQADLKGEIQLLKAEYLKRRPLSKADVEELVVKISEQPKFIEKQTEALTEELTRKVEKLEELIHHLKRSLFG